MKWKIATIILAIALVFVGCSEPDESNVVAKSYFTMEKIDSDWGWYIYEDTETHIQYILYKDSDGHCAITPRYERADGLLYTEGGIE